MNCTASGLLLRFQRIAVYPFWGKRVYKWNTVKAYYSSLPHSPAGNVFLTWSFIRTHWWLFCTTLVEGAVGFTGPNFWSVLQSCRVLQTRLWREGRSVCQGQETQWTVLSEAWPWYFPTCSVLSFFAILCTTTYLGLGLYYISWWGSCENLSWSHYFILAGFL